MSKPSALPSPLSAGEQAGADRAAGGAGEHAPGAGPARLLGARDAARGLHHQRSRQAGRRGGLAEPAQVAAEQGGEVGVDRRGRAALVLAEAGQDLVRGGDVQAGQLAAQVLGDALLVAGVEVGEEQADRDRLGAAVAQRARPGGPAPPRRAARPRRRGRCARPPRSAARPRPGAPASARRGGRAGGGPGGRSRAGRRSRGWRSAPCGRRVPPAGRWCRPSSRGRRPRPRQRSRRPARAPLRPRRSPPATGPRAWSAASPCGAARRRERTASVKVPPTSTPSSIGRSYRPR